MAAQYFPVQTIRNMSAHHRDAAAPTGESFSVGSARGARAANPHGLTRALAFRIEDGARVLVYASDAGYGPDGPSREAIALYADADLLIHDSSYTPEDRAAYPDRGLSSSDEALEAALRSRTRRLALFHYDQDYSDRDVDQLLARSRRRAARTATPAPAGRSLAAAEGQTLTV